MGADMEDLKGRTVRDDGEVMLMPLVYKPDIVLVPGQILPLVFFHPQVNFSVDNKKSCLENIYFYSHRFELVKLK